MLQTVAIRTPKYLCIKDNSLIIREKGSSVVLGKIALSDIWVIIIDNPQVTMTSALISGINDAGIGVLYCGSDHMQSNSHSPWGHIRDMPRSSSTSSLSQSHCETKFGNGSSRRKSRTKLKHSHCASVTRLKLKKSAAMPRKSKATTRQIAKALPQVNTSRHFYPTGHVGMAL